MAAGQSGSAVSAGGEAAAAATHAVRLGMGPHFPRALMLHTCASLFLNLGALPWSVGILEEVNPEAAVKPTEIKRSIANHNSQTSSQRPLSMVFAGQASLSHF